MMSVGEMEKLLLVMMSVGKMEKMMLITVERWR